MYGMIGDTMKLIHDDTFFGMENTDRSSVDCIICDLPFGTTKHCWDTSVNLFQLWYHYGRLVKVGGAIVLFSTQPYTTVLINSNLKGFKYSWIWNKKQAGNFAVAKHMPLMVHEDILIFTNHGEKITYYPEMRTGKMRTKGGKASTKNGSGFGGLKNISYTSDQYFPTSILEYPSVPRTQRLHSSEKPVELLRYLVRTYSKEGQTIMDNTMGSGSTGVACEIENRDFIGIECEKNSSTLPKRD